MEDQKTATVVIKTGLNKFALDDFITENTITREQIITITEPEKGNFTLIFEGTAEQYATYHDDLTQRRAALSGATGRSMRREPQSYTIGGRR